MSIGSRMDTPDSSARSAALDIGGASGDVLWVSGHRTPPRFLVSLALLWATACGVPDGSGTEGENGEGPTVLRVWAHSGQDAERQVIRAQAERFNVSQHDLRVELELIPEGSYHEQVQAAALAGDLPDVMELDGPFVAAYAWQGHLQPLDSMMPDTLLTDLLPSIVAQGRYAGRLWALGAYDSGLGLFARRSALNAVGARLPTRPGDAWSVAELEQWMRALAEHDEDGAVMDLHLNYRGEWYTYALAPALRSGGGGLLDLQRMRAAGTFDDRASVGVLTRIQGWMQNGWVDRNIDDAAFTEGRVALSWSGHWDYRRYRASWEDDVVVLPLPDFGTGTRTGQGSWVWAITRAAGEPRAAARWIRFLLSPAEVRAMTDANAAVPARVSVADASALYGPEGPLRILLDQLRGGWAAPRPATPAYPIVTSRFQEVIEAVVNGEDAADAAGSAARLIDREIEDNGGYPPLDDRP